MNRDEAKQILLAYRPGTADAEDAEIAEALALAKSDAGLSDWLERHLDEQRTIRSVLQGIATPGDLKDEILQAHATFVRNHRHPTWIPWAAAALLTLSFVLAGLRMSERAESRSFATFRDRMVATAIREYRMDIESSDVSTVQSFLDGQNSGLRLPITPGLERTPLFGAGRLSWKGNPVTMVCFKTDAGQLLFLFATDRDAVKEPPGVAPQFSSLSRLNVAGWSNGTTVFVLAGELDRAQLEDLL